jgi:hypothetical protein
MKVFALGYLGGWAGLVVSNMFGSRLDSNEIVLQFWIMTGALFAAHRGLESDEGEQRSSPEATPPPRRLSTTGPASRREAPAKGYPWLRRRKDAPQT